MAEVTFRVLNVVVPFDRPHKISHLSSVVIMFLRYTISKLLLLVHEHKKLSYCRGIVRCLNFVRCCTTVRI